MKAVAISDLHLGHRRFPAVVDGRNAREVDVERALDRALENILDANPDLVTVAGDVVDHPRVSVHSIMAWREFVRRIVSETSAHLVAVQGNHDAAKTTTTRSPIVVPSDYDRAHIITTPQRVRFTAASTGEVVAIACFPYSSLQGEEETYRLDPDPDADVNVLLIHAAAKSDESGDLLPWWYQGERSLDVSRVADDFDVAAAGDFHEFRRLHPDALAFYSGAVERTSSNIWEEEAEKGVVVYDTRAGEMQFVPHETRPVRDFELAGEVDAGRTNFVLEDLAEKDLAGEIVRLVVRDFPREQRDAVDWEQVAEIKKTCLHFQLDLRWSEDRMAGFRQGAEGPNRSIEKDARDFFADDDPAVRALAWRYLEIEGEPQEPHEDVLYHCPSCGNRDTYAPGHSPPCSGGCGERMVEGTSTDRQLAAGGVS